MSERARIVLWMLAVVVAFSLGSAASAVIYYALVGRSP